MTHSFSEIPDKDALLSHAAISAARRGLDPTAQAVMFHLVAFAKLGDDGWTVDDMSQQTLANRLGASVETIARALQRLNPIIDYRPGKGSLTSRYVFRPPGSTPTT